MRGRHDPDLGTTFSSSWEVVLEKAPIEPHVLRSSERPSRLKARSQGGLVKEARPDD